jgi:hypothetical protein
MNSPADFMRMDFTSLVDALIDAAGERALLIYDEAPEEELREVQQKMDLIQEQLGRRASW